MHANNYRGGLRIVKWKLRDVVLLVILAVVSGGIYRIWDIIVAFPFYNAISPSLQGLFNGFWFIASGLIPYIIRRPGAALIAELVAAMIEQALGSQFGITNLSWGLVQGIGSEIAFALFIWRNYSWPVMLLNGALAGVGADILWYFTSGGNSYSHGIVVQYFLYTIISGAVVGGWLPKLIADAMNRAGILRNFALGRAAQAKK